MTNTTIDLTRVYNVVVAENQDKEDANRQAADAIVYISELEAEHEKNAEVTK